MKPVNRRFLIAALGGLMGAATAATAAPAAGPSFKTYDANHDGKVSLQEFLARGGKEQAFRVADANHDNVLSQDEFATAVSVSDRIKAGNYVDDSWITAKVKALLLKDEGVKGLDVNVETHQGTVLLSGWVNNTSQIAEALKVAGSVDGVKEVKNGLMVNR